MAGLLGCNVGSFPIPYLGMKIGGRVVGTADWSDLVDRIKKKVRGWESLNLSIGGRVTLINSIISALPLYRLSFAHMPKDIDKKIRAVMCNFLWGGKEGLRKRAWIKWDFICQSKKDGGLGIRNLLNVNLALLLKWVWRFLREEENLWARVIRSRHGGLECGREGISVVGRGGTRGGWWAKVVALAGGEKGKWFREKLELILGDGRKANFWEGRWSGDRTVKQRYPRLFQLSILKNRKVADMGRWEEGRWRWIVEWRRVLLDREKGMVEEFLLFLDNFSLFEGQEDQWKWGKANDGAFSIKEAYGDISSEGREAMAAAEIVDSLRAIWKSVAPFKAQIMTWRLLLNRLPTINNLLKVMVISREEQSCRGCKETLETASHFFLQCVEAGEIWNKVIEWLGVKWAPPCSMVDHFRAFSGLAQDKARRSSLRVCGCVWFG